MGTLLKYEFRRSRVIFLGIIGVTLLVELLYLVGWCFKLETPLLLGIIGGVLCLAFGAMAILLYGVIMFNDDISKKPGYLLFSTPRSAAQIVGAKLLMTLLALLGITVLFTLLIAVDVFLALQRNGTSIVALLSMFDASITESGLKDALFNGYNFFGLAMYILNMVYFPGHYSICCDYSAENCNGQSERTHHSGSDSLVCDYQCGQHVGRTVHNASGFWSG